MAERFYDSPEWRHLRERALARDGSRCTVARLLGGDCSAILHAHHLIPVSDGGPELPTLDGVVTACASHHPMLEAMRRYVLRKHQPRRCRHRHPYAEGRRQCEARLARAA